MEKELKISFIYFNPDSNILQPWIIKTITYLKKRYKKNKIEIA